MRDPYACPDCGESEDIDATGEETDDGYTVLRCHSCGECWAPYYSARGIDEWSPDDDDLPSDAAW